MSRVIGHHAKEAAFSAAERGPEGAPQRRPGGTMINDLINRVEAASGGDCVPARARRQADKLRDFALELEIPDDTASNIYAAEMRKGAALLDELERRHP